MVRNKTYCNIYEVHYIRLFGILYIVVVKERMELFLHIDYDGRRGMNMLHKTQYMFLNFASKIYTGRLHEDTWTWIR